ncbi:MAG: hypothetical protein M1308_10005 [Actinobacteria bacterium]|nr:hypothetical protein [Actinomycetota bacterium]
MHAFTIVSQSDNKKIEKEQEILKSFRVKKFNIITLASTDSSIKALREIQKLLKYKTAQGDTKALIIENVDNLSDVAQQALLKTIEEPPKNTIIIIKANNTTNLLPTILSRTQIYFLPHKEIQSKEDEKKYFDFWKNILSRNNPGLRLKESVAFVSSFENKDSMLDWIDKQSIFFSHLLEIRVDEPNKGKLKPQAIMKILRLLLFVKKNLNANINSKLLLDNFFINLPYI